MAGQGLVSLCSRLLVIYTYMINALVPHVSKDPRDPALQDMWGSGCTTEVMIYSGDFSLAGAPLPVPVSLARFLPPLRHKLKERMEKWEGRGTEEKMGSSSLDDTPYSSL